jgi:hypothetical protein
MGCVHKIKNLNLDELSGHTKACSGCDPDVPGHVETAFCTRCRGTGREPMGFSMAAGELDESRREASVQAKTRGRGRGMQAMDTEDADLYLEY